ncbi:MAG: NAD-dependent epimerase/dehydratase family protein [Chitinophagaceae bacterium]
MGKNILITGGAGFIGSNLTLKLLQKNYSITILDNLSPQVHGKNPIVTSSLYKSIIGKVNFIHGCVTIQKDWEKALKNIDIIVHLAAETGTGQSMYKVNKYTNINIGGTALMLDILANQKHNIQKIIVGSSRAIYGEGRYLSKELGFVYPLPRTEKYMKEGFFECVFEGCSSLELVSTTENSTIHPTSVYGITKQVQEQLVMTVSPTIGITPIAFRYQNVYGPGQSLQNPYTGILSIFSTRIKCKNAINIFEDGLESRDFVYIEDVVEATILGIEKKGFTENIFNIGTGIATSVLTVANTLIKKYGIHIPINISGNYRLGDIRHNFADITIAKKVLGFFPKWDFEKGISKFIDWVNNENYYEDNYEKSIQEMKTRGVYK